MKNIAPLSHRIIAAVIDVLVCITIYQVLILTILCAPNIREILAACLTTLIYILVILPIFLPLMNLILLTTLGGTIGKLATGIRVVDVKGNNLTFIKAFVRNIVGYIVSSIFFWLGFIWIAIDQERRGWHDMIADSYVVKKSESGIITGLLVLLVLLGANFYIGYLSFKNVTANLPLYKETIEDLTAELNKPSVEKRMKESQNILYTTPSVNKSLFY